MTTKPLENRELRRELYVLFSLTHSLFKEIKLSKIAVFQKIYVWPTLFNFFFQVEIKIKFVTETVVKVHLLDFRLEYLKGF